MLKRDIRRRTDSVCRILRHRLLCSRNLLSSTRVRQCVIALRSVNTLKKTCIEGLHPGPCQRAALLHGTTTRVSVSVSHIVTTLNRELLFVVLQQRLATRARNCAKLFVVEFTPRVRTFSTSPLAFPDKPGSAPCLDLLSKFAAS